MTMHPAAADIRCATVEDAEAVATLIATAFEPLDLTGWLVPNATDRIPVMAGYLQMTVEHAIAHGTVDIVGDLFGAAVWLPATAPDLPEDTIRLQTITGTHLPRFQALEAAMHAAHPTRPHEYLPFIAVHPQVQTCGLGSALLAHHHAVLDHCGQAAYLEAASPASARLYHRHGYRPMQAPFGPDGSSARLHPMWRPPTPPGDDHPQQTCDEQGFRR